MAETPAQRAYAASTVSLLLALGALVLFLPPFVHQTTASVLRTVVTAGVLVTALLLHWVFLGIGARRAGRSVGFWVGAMAVLLCPIGGAAALVLLGWFDSEAAVPAPAPRHG